MICKDKTSQVSYSAISDYDVQKNKNNHAT